MEEKANIRKQRGTRLTLSRIERERESERFSRAEEKRGGGEEI